MGNIYSPNGAVPGNQLGPMAMPGYNLSDVYGGMFGSQPQAAPASVPHANGTLDYTKDQSQLMQGNPMVANPALDAISTATRPTGQWDSLFRSLMAPGSGPMTEFGLPLTDGGELPPGAPPVDALTPNAPFDPWAGMTTDGARRTYPAAAPAATRGNTVTGPDWLINQPDPYGYIKAAPGLTTAQTHARLMAQGAEPTINDILRSGNLSQNQEASLVWGSGGRGGSGTTGFANPRPPGTPNAAPAPLPGRHKMASHAAPGVLAVHAALSARAARNKYGNSYETAF